MHHLPELDEETKEFILHLRVLAVGEVSEDGLVADNFSIGLNYHDPLLYSFRDGESLYNPVLHDLVRLLLQVIPVSSMPYQDLLEKILRPLTFDEICTYIPKKMIYESVRDPITRHFALSILNEQLLKDAEAVSFVSEHGLVYDLLSDVVNLTTRFTDGHLVHNLVSGMIRHNPNLIDTSKLRFLSEMPLNFITSPDHFYNFTLAVTVISCLNLSDQPWAENLFPFEFLQMHDISELHPTYHYIKYTTLLCCDYIDKVPFTWLKPFVGGLLHYVSRKYSNKLAPDFSNDYIMAYQDLVICLFKSEGDSLNFVIDFVSKPENNILDLKDQNSVRFFSAIDIKNIPHKTEFFLSHLFDLDVHAGGIIAVTCVSTLVRDECFFHLLVSHNKLTYESLEMWHRNDILVLLNQMASYDYSSQYLISNLPELIVKHLITLDTTITDKKAWGNIREALKKLLLQRSVDLGCWKTELTKSLYEVENGRRLTTVEPRVEVANLSA